MNIKEFFSPIKGGRNDGKTFAKIILLKPDNLAITAATIFFMAYAVPTQEFDDPAIKWVLEGAFLAIFSLVTFKSLQHWSELKNKKK